MLENFLALFKNKPVFARRSDIKPTVLLVLDGYGIAPKGEGNAVSRAQKPNIDSYFSSFPHGEIIASGESVGLPANEVGNTEVGHLTIGAGRVIDQDLVRINKSIKDTSFYDNRALLDALAHARNKQNAKLHIAGLVGEGNVHSSMYHFWALLEFCKKNHFQNVYLHLFTDGRDSPPQEGISTIKKIETELKSSGAAKIATVTGRYFAMDRDGRWDRTKLVYEAMVLGKGVAAKIASEAIKASYEAGKTDEFIEPIIVTNDAGLPMAKIDDGDSFIFFNFRIDRPRQLTMAFVVKDFEKLKEFNFGDDPEKEGKETGVIRFTSGTFTRTKLVNDLFFVTMTEYQKNLPVSGICFPKIIVNDTLSETIAKNKLTQMHMAESEKERFVTYYFDGQREEKFPGEDQKIVPSQKVATYDKRPQMSVFEIVNEFKNILSWGKYNFFVLNFANADMVGHTGNLDAAIKAIGFLDKAIGELVNATLEAQGSVVITADHGNAEEMLTYPTTSFFITTEKGKISTDHSNNPVPVIVISPRLRSRTYTLRRGSLSDIAPTVLDLMGLPKPAAMTGTSLLEGSVK